MSDEITSPALPSSNGLGGISIGSLYGEVSLRHDQLDRDAVAMKASVAGLAQQLGSLGGVPVAPGLAGQFQQVAAVLAPLTAGVSALGGLLGGLTLNASGISGGADKAVAAMGRVRAAAANAPGAIRLPDTASGSGALTAAQKSALAVERARIGGNAIGRLQVERDRALAGLRDRGASAAQAALAASGYDARIDAAQAASAARRQAGMAREEAAAVRRGTSGASALASLEAALRARIAAGAGRGGSPQAALEERLRKLSSDYAAWMARIDKLAGSLPGGAGNAGVVQARASAAGALSAGRSAANSDYTKTTDAQGLQTLNASLERLRAKRDLFLSGWRANGEDARRFLTDLAGLYNQVSAAAAATPGQADAQARMLAEIGGAARTATQQARELPAAARDAQAALGGAFGDAVERSLAESQSGAGGFGQRRRRSSFSQAMRRDWSAEMERGLDSEIGRAAQRGVSGLMGDAFRGVSRWFSPGGRSTSAYGSKADGSATNPFHVVAAGADAMPGSPGVQPGAMPAQPFGGMSASSGGGSGLSGSAASAAQAAPWIAASLALSKALGGQKTFAGRLFNGGLLGAFFKHSPLHFAVGGAVPDEGKGGSGGDTVPAMLTPGEFVLSRPMLAQIAGMSGRSYSMDSSGGDAYRSAPDTMASGRNAALGAGAGGVNVTVHQHGDTHFHTDADMDEFSRRQAWSIKNQLQTSAPGLF